MQYWHLSENLEENEQLKKNETLDKGTLEHEVFPNYSGLEFAMIFVVIHYITIKSDK